MYSMRKLDEFKQLCRVYDFISQVGTLYEKQVGFRSVRQFFYSVRPADSVLRSLVPLTNLSQEEKDL